MFSFTPEDGQGLVVRKTPSARLGRLAYHQYTTSTDRTDQRWWCNPHHLPLATTVREREIQASIPHVSLKHAKGGSQIEEVELWVHLGG